MGGYRPPLLESIPAPAPLTESDIRVQPAAPPSPKSERGIGYMGSGGKSAAIAGNFLTGWLESMRAGEIRKAQQANRAVDFARQGYAGARKSFEEFATRDDVRKAADKYADWVRSNANVGEEEFFARGGEQAQPPLEAREANLLQELGQRKAAAESAKHMYANVLQQFVMPEPGAKGKKGKEGGVQGIPIIGNIVQALAPNIDPQMVPAAMVEMVRREEIRAPELSAEERYQQTRLAEFEEGAELRKKEREVTGAELDIRANKAKMQSEYGTALDAYDKMPAGPDREAAGKRLEEMETRMARLGVEGARSPQEQLGEETAKIGLSVLDKVKRGVKPDQFTDAEKAWYQRTLQYQPTNIEQAIVSKIGTTVNGRVFTLDDAINEVVRANARIAAAGRQPSAFAQQLEFYRDAEAFTQFQRSYGQLDQGQRGTVDKAVATRLKATPEERALAKVADPLVLQEKVSEALQEAAAKDPRFSKFLKGRTVNPRVSYRPGEKKPTTSGEVRYSFNPNPSPEGGFMGMGGTEGFKTQADVDVARKAFITEATSVMRRFGFSEEQIQTALSGAMPQEGGGATAGEYTVTDPSTGQSRTLTLSPGQVANFRKGGLKVEPIATRGVTEPPIRVPSRERGGT